MNIMRLTNSFFYSIIKDILGGVKVSTGVMNFVKHAEFA